MFGFALGGRRQAGRVLAARAEHQRRLLSVMTSAETATLPSVRRPAPRGRRGGRGSTRRSRATAASAEGTSTNVRGSRALTPNSSPDNTCVSARAPGDPDGEPGAGQLHSAAQHHPQDAAAIGAERHPDADLVSPLGCRVRQHAVDADRRQHQRDGGKDPEQEGHEPPVGFGSRDSLGDGSHARYRLIPIDRPDLRLRGPRERRWIAAGPNEHEHAPVARLLMREVGLRPHRAAEATAARVGNDADDRAPPHLGIGRIAEGDPPAEGIFIRKETADERFVHQRYRLRLLGIGVV